MFDDQWDPYETLKNHDEWLLKMAENGEALARAGVDLSRALEKHEGMIRHLALTIAHQQKLILKLNDRLELLEKK